MPLATCPSANELEQLFQGQPSDDTAERLESHLQECSSCLTRLKDLLGAKDTVSGSFAGVDSLGDAAAQPVVRQLMDKLEGLKPDTASDATAGFVTPSSGSPISGTDGDEVTDEHETLTVTQIAHYQLGKMLGAGGMGMVFEALDTHLERPVALKVMKPSVAKNAASRKRFLQEARSAAKIQHDHIVSIFQVGEDQGIPFLAMQLLEGVSLSDLLKRHGTLKTPQVIRLGLQIAEGLAAAHERGLIHRDIKPGNIWIEPVKGGRAKILDFGLARLEKGNAQITTSGMIVGTPAYMAPEQARGEKNVDARVDLFSLGCVLYLMSTGIMPFTGNDAVGVLMAVQMQEPPAPRDINPEVPQALSELIVKLLAKDPAGRPASAKDVVKALQGLERSQGPAQSAGNTEMLAAISAAANAPSATVATPAEASNPFAHLSQPNVGQDSAPVRSATDIVQPGQERSPVLRKTSRRLAQLAVAAGFVALVAAGIVFYLQTPHGTIRVEVLDDKTDVRLSQGKLHVTGNDAKEITIEPGERTLKISRDGFNFETPQFALKKGDKITFQITFIEGRVLISKNGVPFHSQAPPVQVAQAVPPRDFGLEFDGKSAYVEIASLRCDANDPFTIEAIVTADKNVGTRNHCVVAIAGTVPTGFSIGGRHFTAGRAADDLEIAAIAKDALRTEEKMHLAAVYEGNTCKFYVNGQNLSQSWQPGQLPERRNAYAKSVSMIGSDPTDKGAYFGGRIHGVRISRSARYRKDYKPGIRFEPDADTLALYHFDEGQGDKLVDSSGNGHHGKIVGAKWVKAEGTSLEPVPLAARGGLLFKESDKVVLPKMSVLGLERGAPFTVEAYVIPAMDRYPQGSIIVGRRGEFNLVAAEQQWKFLIHEGEGTGPPLKVEAPLIAGRPTHLAGVSDGKEMTLFVDGKRVGSHKRTKSGTHKVYSVLFIGDGFVGQVLGVRLSRVARYSKDYTPETRYLADQDTLAVYQFDEGQGDELKDSSGNGHHGKIVGAKWVKADTLAPASSNAFPLVFDGSARVALPNFKVPAETYTWEAYVNLSRPSVGLTNVNFIQQVGAPGLGFIVDPKEGPCWAFRYEYSGHVRGGPVKMKTRQHVAVVLTAQEAILFVDGVLENRGKVGPKASARRKEFALAIGDHLVGSLAEVRISGGIRYQNNFVPTPRFETDADTLALYHCDEGQGDVLKDSSGNGHHGRIIGAKWVKMDGSPLPGIVTGSPLDRVQAKLKAGQPVTLVTMGDSLTAKLDANKINWTDLLRDRLHEKYKSKVSVSNVAVGGSNVTQGIAQIPKWLAGTPEPDLVVLCFGYNDWKTGVSGAEYQKKYLDAVDTLRQATKGKAEILLMTTVPAIARWGTMVELSDAIRQVARRQNVGLADTEKAFLESGRSHKEKLFIGDGIHLSAAGDDLLAQTVLAAIESQRAQNGTTSKFTNSLGMEFALVPKGKAWLGGGRGKPGDKEVEFKEDFYLGVYELTVEEWEKVMGQTPGGVNPANQRHPVEGVTWDDCQQLVKRLNEVSKEVGWEYRLPTGDEWEYACRGGPMSGKEESAFDYYLDKPSNELRPDQANFLDKNPCVVGSYKPNRLGIHDMHANVAEWCNDAEQPLPKDATKAKRLFCGGVWGGRDATLCTATRKTYSPPSRRESYLGLRLARVRAADPDRRAAEWVLRVGGQVSIRVANKNLPLVKQLPDAPFEVYQITIGKVNAADAGFANLNGLQKLTQLNLQHAPISDAGLAHLRDLPSLCDLTLNHTQVTGAGLEGLKNLKQLRNLNLENIKPGATGLKHLRALTSLEGLQLSGVSSTDQDIDAIVALAKLRRVVIAGFGGIADPDAALTKIAALPELQELSFILSSGYRRATEAGFKNLGRLTALKSLTLRGAGLDDRSLVHLEPLQELETLDVRGNDVSGAGFASLMGKHRRLKRLELGENPIPDEGLREIAALKSLKQLILSHTKVTNTGLAHLKNLAHLESLQLDNLPVTDAGLEQLKDLSKLHFLNLRKTKVTAAGAKALAAALPGCKIELDSGTIGPMTSARFTNTLGMEFALIPKGKTWMGGMAAKAPHVQGVDFKNDFYLGVYEVTQEEWQKVMGSNPSGHAQKGKKSDAIKAISPDDLQRFPVEMVSFNDAQEFVARLNEKVMDPGWVYRLPTQAEWQYACRGGPLVTKEDLGFDYYFDRPTNVLLPDRANFNRNVGRPKKVGSYLPNRLGLYDMHGNVGEWCHDTMIDADGSVRALSHGGSWTHQAEWCRAVFIIRSQPFARFDDMGFRLARVPVGAQDK